MDKETIPKIDFVLPWVDGSDPIWQKSKDQYDSSISKEHNAIVSNYRDLGTLKYVLRSIEKNCPWYNKIHIITCGHHPSWLDISHPKINLITHQELYFDTSHLPVFSSSSIEMNLPNLQGVSEQFIYLNDDTIILNPLKKERFFQEGKPVDFLSHGWLVRNKLFSKLRGMDTWTHSINNILKLINNKFQPVNFDKKYLYHSTYPPLNKLSNFLLQHYYRKFIWIEHWHHPKPYLMSTLNKVYSELKDEMMSCSKNKFRTNNDLTQYLYRYWDLAQQNFSPYKYNDGFVRNLISERELQEIINSITSNINFICLNDSFKLKDAEFHKVQSLLERFLEDKFDEPASFEK